MANSIGLGNNGVSPAYYAENSVKKGRVSLPCASSESLYVLNKSSATLHLRHGPFEKPDPPFDAELKPREWLLMQQVHGKHEIDVAAVGDAPFEIIYFRFSR